MMRRLLVLGFAATVALSAMGCSTTNVTTRLKLPARTLELQEKQQVLVLGFTGQRGDAATVAMRNAINKGRFHGIVDSRFDNVRSQQLAKRLEAGGTVDLSNSVPAGATVIVSGQTADDIYAKDVSESEKEKCTKKNKKGECLKKVLVKVYTLKEQCESSVVLRAARVKDGAVLVDWTFTQATEKTSSKEKLVPNDNRRKICDAAFKASMENATHFITPFEAQVTLAFHDIDDPGKATERAVEEVKMGKLESAHKKFESVTSAPGLEEKDRGWAHYNLAVIDWAQARFDDCLDQISEAQKYLGADSQVMEMKTACEDYVQ